MNYLQTVQLVSGIITGIIGLLFVHFMFFGFVGLFFKKRYPKTDKINKYGIIIPARNEENVISGLIESVYKNNYRQDKLQIFVIAHNCNDKTADIARSLGATVYEYNNPNERTMGYAFRYLFSCIERDWKTSSYDGFFLFNADNILDNNYFSRMNDAFEFYNRECVITSFRNSKNFGTNLISGLYGVYFATGCRLESRGRTFLGCSTRVQGTGYLINSSIVKNGWPYVTLTEDWEFSADQILQGNRIRYCDDAVFYDEQPTDLCIMWRQRVRWSRGHLLVFIQKGVQLIKSLFAKHTVHRVSVYDIFANTLPSVAFNVLLFVLQILFIIITPLVDPTLTLEEIMIGDSVSLFDSDGLLFAWLRTAMSAYVGLLLNAIAIFVFERKRIKKVPLYKKVLISLAWPIFIAIQIPIDIQAVFSRNLEWKPIPHKDQTKFENVNT